MEQGDGSTLVKYCIKIIVLSVSWLTRLGEKRGYKGA